MLEYTTECSMFRTPVTTNSPLSIMSNVCNISYFSYLGTSSFMNMTAITRTNHFITFKFTLHVQSRDHRDHTTIIQKVYYIKTQQYYIIIGIL